MLLTRDQILGATKFDFVDVSVPSFGGDVRVRDMGALERDQLAQYVSALQAEKSFEKHVWEYKLMLCALAICDDNGAPLFTHNDVAALGTKDRKAIDLIFKAAADINGLTPEKVDAEEKKSETPETASGSDSPAILAEPSVS